MTVQKEKSDRVHNSLHSTLLRQIWVPGECFATVPLSQSRPQPGPLPPANAHTEKCSAHTFLPVTPQPQWTHCYHCHGLSLYMKHSFLFFFPLMIIQHWIQPHRDTYPKYEHWTDTEPQHSSRSDTLILAGGRHWEDRHANANISRRMTLRGQTR